MTLGEQVLTMTHARRTAQQKKEHGLNLRLLPFRVGVKTALLRHPHIRTVSALSEKIGRPRSSVSRAINNGVFPELRKQIMEALGL